MPDRTPEERERDRLEREARRAKKEGRQPPTPPQPPAEPSNVPILPPSREKMDVQPDPEPVEPVPPAPAAPAPPPPPPATGRDWRREAGEPDPDPPLVRRVERDAPREEVQDHREPLPEPTRPAPPGRRIPPPPPLEEDRALGTKRVTGARRPHLPRRGASTPGTPGAPSGSPWPRRIGALAALAVVVFVLWFAASLFQPFAGDGGGARTVTVPEGSSVSAVADILVEQGIVDSAFFFKLRAKLEGRDQLRSGRVALRQDMSYAAALDELEATAENAPPVAKTTSVTLPEGLSREEIAERLEGDGIAGDYLKATESVRGFNPRRYGAPAGAPLEGFLFPATYKLKKGQGVDALVKQQLRAFAQNIGSIDLRRAKRKNLSAYDIVVIASMIEREAGIPKDRRLVAAVIYNRLKDGMSLGIDATLRYELKNWTEPLKVSELEADTPYNTRTNTGLPPGPIGNPGLAALEAAADPADVDYLFYVVKPCGDGAHNFSATDAEFQEDVAAYNAKREELGGKSPVTCE